MLRTDKLVKCFGTTVAVDEVSVEIPAGQMVGIIGRSGPANPPSYASSIG
jgi:phosphonate transport system ATP-binding protein